MSFFRFLTAYGPLLQAPLFLYLLFVEQEKVAVIVYFGSAITLVTLLSKIVKLIIRKERPLPGKEEKSAHVYAFPSTHSAALITCSLLFYQFSFTLFFFSFFLTALSLHSRVKTKMHDSSDIVAGALLGGVVWLLLRDDLSTFARVLADVV